MPIHDWTKVPAGIFHAFHQYWVMEISRSLESLLPDGYYALPEQIAGGSSPDVLAFHERGHIGDAATTTIMNRPKVRHHGNADAGAYAKKKTVVAVRHVGGDEIVALIEVVSHGNKDSDRAIKQFVGKIRDFLDAGIHQLLIDLHPPGPRDPDGLHALIVDEFESTLINLAAEGPGCAVAYECAEVVRWYLEPFRVGDSIIDMPIFLKPDFYVNVPLEATYEIAWKALPKRWRDVLEG